MAADANHRRVQQQRVAELQARVAQIAEAQAQQDIQRLVERFQQDREQNGPPPATTTAQPAPQPQAAANEEKIRHLQELGFARQEAIQALIATGGNVEQAANLLF
eukprot:TRINITY_DN3101_c0_g1_i1.p3 TRINITY_DN3101_c0_g1~~TRINITY_DN3101_c0_g1_i1.p3  ORF type:complete len:122 (+),score=32.65 TRINITY_DN3101_c0_g1_i1:53-367(+)